MFITIEGNDGAGKTTMSHLMAEYFNKQGEDVVVLTRAPGGTDMGMEIRKILVNPTGDRCSVLTEFLLLMADRRHHIDSVIQPALDENKVVICDRFMDSTYAYQVAGSGLEEHYFDQIGEKVMQGLEPDYTLMLLCDPAIALHRVIGLRQQKLDRFELEALEFHDRVCSGFVHRAEQFSDRCSIVDGQSELDVVRESVLAFCEEIASKGPRVSRATSSSGDEATQ